MVAPDQPVIAGRPGSGWDLVAAGLLVLVLLRLLVDLGGATRGLEMGDEGYFLLNLNQPAAALPPLEIYRFLGVLRGGAEVGVVQARLLRIAAELVGSLALLLGLLAWTRRRLLPERATSGLAAAALALQGALLTTASRSLGYNDLTNLFSYAAVGCVFFLSAADGAKRRRRVALALAAGVLTGLQLVTKFPPAALLVVLVVAVVGLALPWLPRWERVVLLGAYGSACALLVALVVASTGGAGAMAERLAVASRLPALTHYDPVAIVRRSLYLEQLTIRNLGVFWLAFAGAYAILRRETPERRLVLASVVGCIVLLAGVLRWQPNFLHPSLVYLACAVLGLATVLLVLARMRTGPPPHGATARERIGLLLVLLVLPFVEIAGTNVPVTLRLPTHVLPLFALLAVLLAERHPGSGGPLYRTVAAVLAAVGALVFWQHHWQRPYGLRTPLHEQATPLRGIPGISVDLASARFLDSVADTLEAAGYRRGDPVIALDYMPGLVSYLGATSPRYNLYMFGLPEYNCFNLNQAAFREPPFVIVAREPSVEQRRCISSIDIPNSYELLRTLAFPYQDAYVSFGVHDFSHVQIYGPRPLPAEAGR